MRYLKKLNPSFSVFFLKLIGAGCTFFVSILFMYFSDSELLGKYALNITIVTFLAVVVVFGQNVYLMRLLTSSNAGEYKNVEDVFFHCFIVYLFLLPLVLVFLLLVSSFTSVFFLMLFTYYCVFQLYSSLMLVYGRPVLNAFFNDFLRPFWGLLYVVISMLITFIGYDIDDAFLLGSILLVIPILFAFYWVANFLNFNIERFFIAARNINIASVKIFCVRGYSACFVGILGLLIVQFDRVYVAVILGYSAAGVYFAAQTLVSIVSYFNQALISGFIASMVKAYQEDNIAGLENISRVNAWKSFVFSLVAIASYVLCYPIIKVIFNVSGSDFFWIAIVLFSMNSIGLLFGFGSVMMLYSGDVGQKKLIKFNLISFFLGVILGSVLVYLFGVVGAAFGTGVSILISRILPFMYFRKMGYSLGVFRI